MKSNRSNSVIILFCLMTLLSCTKQEYNVVEIKDECPVASDFLPSIVGKWKLLDWNAGYINLNDCSSLGGGNFNASAENVNIVIEVKQNAMINLYENNVLVNTSVISKALTNNLNYSGLMLNGGQSLYGFYTLNGTDFLSSISIGDTLKITNPFVNLNYELNNVRTFANTQYYLKIE